MSDFDAGSMVRAARAAAGLSQRELAAASDVAVSVLACIESGATRSPSVRTLSRLLASCGCHLVAQRTDGTALERLATDDHRDRGDRLFPAHLTVRSAARWGDWWPDGWPSMLDVPRPDWTFDGRPRGRRRRRAASRRADDDASPE